MIRVHTNLGGLGVCAWAVGLLIRVRTHLGLQVWVPRSLIWVLINPGFRCVLGLLLVFTVQGLRGEGRQRPPAVESSLTSH